MSLNNKISANFLPEFLQTENNLKFLSSTIDPLLQKPDLERIDGFIGNKLSLNFNNLTDTYVQQNSKLRTNYSLEPALIFKNINQDTENVISFEDLINYFSSNNRNIDDFNKIFNSKVYSFDPLIDWDKFVNFSEYYWLPNGPDTIVLNQICIDVELEILNKKSYLMPNGYYLSNGMKIKFLENTVSSKYFNKTFIVEGVGNKINLIDFELLIPDDQLSSVVNETFDTFNFDELGLDADVKLPLTPEYITINKASKDLNSWSRYNRWFHVDVIKTSFIINNKNIDIKYQNKAKRPIIEFKPNLQLFKFGKKGIKNIDLIDSTTTNAFRDIQNSTGYYIDGKILQPGFRVIFNNDEDSSVKGKIFIVSYNLLDISTPRINLIPDENVEINDLDSISVNYGNQFKGKSFYFDKQTNTWLISQQHSFINQEPIFDLFDKNGISYSKISNINNFNGNKIFGYDKGTGTNDEILGFPLKYKNSISVGSYLFKNYFMTENIEVLNQGEMFKILTGTTYIKINDEESEILVNVWNKNVYENKIPLLELQTIVNNTNTLLVESVSLDNLESAFVLINNKKQNILEINTATNSIKLENDIESNSNVLIKLITDKIPNDKSYYETPISLTNNPFNEIIDNFSYTELIDHYSTMIDNLNEFQGSKFGNNNLRDLYNYERLGTRLVVNSNPIAFSMFFLSNKNHNAVDAFRFSADQYDQFKMNFIRNLNKISEQIPAHEALDIIISEITKNKTNTDPFYRSDMIGFGNNKIILNFNVDDASITDYPYNFEFTINGLNKQSLLVYLNDVQLVINYDYKINEVENYISLLLPLNENDKVSIIYYQSTFGNYIAPTPTKLGLYPKFKPEIFYDDTFVNGPIKMIRGHDGSLTKAFNDYRDNIILEYEKRVFNNIKINYNNKIFDLNSVIPGIFRKNYENKKEFNKVLKNEFLLWAGKYGVDYEKNITFEESDYRTWNYKDSIDLLKNLEISGSWKSIFKYFYDTFEPNTKPWEMLGFSNMPTGWIDVYGLPPYTSQNLLLWQDLEKGYDRITGTINKLYSRPGLLNFIPVNENGSLKIPHEFLINTSTVNYKNNQWTFGDFSPSEVAWRNSSHYTFAINIAAMLIDSSNYSSYMYDVSRITINPLEQITYKEDDLYLNLKKLVIENENDQQISGFGSYVYEFGNQKNINYINLLRNDLNNLTIKLFHKLGGFTSKDKIQLSIDSIDPISRSPGVFLSDQDYELIYNVSNPIKFLNISGIIIQKNNEKFIVKGYDKLHPYFKIFPVLKNTKFSTLTVGGISEKFSEWSSGVDVVNKNINNNELTTANSVTTRYYKQGQIVRYENKFYRVKVGHNAKSSFDTNLFQILSELPKKGGVRVNSYNNFEFKEIEIPYGTEFNSVQEVYDFIIGHGAWLENQGFIFDEYNLDLNEIINWKFSAKEFLFWTLQNWSNNNLITISPFANVLKYKNDFAIVDNLINLKYDYIILKDDGNILPITKLNVTRENNQFKILSNDQYDGIFFASLRLIQKENGIIFNNFSTFNDLIYDTKTGYRQQRIKFTGFRTKNWNGDLFSPGFAFNNVKINDWVPYQSYIIGDIVKYKDNYYQSNVKNLGTRTFEFSQWVKLNEKPSSELIPNFDYKISQFEDFYSLDIDNFDNNQQLLAQKLTGYIPRLYLKNIIFNPISQYKFYQGFIKEKGTKNPLIKLLNSNQYYANNNININEEWAFRTGFYGGYATYKEIEFTLNEKTYLENPYIIKFADTNTSIDNTLINLKYIDDLLIVPNNYNPLTTFGLYKSNFDDNNLVLPNAGYVRLDDVTATAYNKNSILDIFNNNLILNGDTIWTGFLENGNWTVYRYSIQDVKISGVFVQLPGSSITFVTDGFHNLSVGDIISVVKFNDQVNGIYIVVDIPKLNQFTVSSDLTTIINEELLSLGILFKFENARFSDINDLKDQNIFKLSTKSKFWIDSNQDQKWTVLEKTNNFENQIFESVETSAGQLLGNTIYTSDDIELLMVSSPGNRTQESYSIGKISIFDKNKVEKKFDYELNSNEKTYCESTSTSEFGFSMSYIKNKELFVVGAPSASNVRALTTTGIVISTGIEIAKPYPQEGLVKISTNNINFLSEITKLVIVNPDAITSSTASYSRFGHSIFTFDNVDNTVLIVGAPGNKNYLGSGKVYAYEITSTIISNEINLTEYIPGLEVTSTSTIMLHSGSNWGYSISGSKNGEIIAISAPYYQNTNSNVVGIIQLFDKNLNWKQNLLPSINEECIFGFKVVVSNDGNYIFVSSTGIESNIQSTGKVFVFKYNLTTSIYQEIQILNNPESNTTLKFGHDISLSNNNKILTISSLGTLKSKSFNFVNFNNEKITFDNNTTDFNFIIEDSGTVYVYENFNDYFVQSIELNDVDILENSKYGKSIVATDSSIFVGAPYITGVGIKSFTVINDIEFDINENLVLNIEEPTQYLGIKPSVEILYTNISETVKKVNTIKLVNPGSGYTKIPVAYLTNNINITISLRAILEFDNSKFYKFSLIDPMFISLKEKRLQEDLVDVTQIKKVSLIDNINENIIDYLEVIDPIKGKISGLADQEITYKVEYDPAVYSFGLVGTMNDPENNWLDDHVGELWWDLSNTKFILYEQGEELYRKNNWGKLFPGAAIDIYEWVKSDLLPSEWAAIADTNGGLIKGISGQPKYPDNTVLSAKQVFNNITNSLQNVYYFWVKNKVIVPDTKNRRKSSLEVASLINDPVANGLKFISILSKDSIALANIQSLINKTNINIVLDIENSIPRHTEWLLLEEGNPNSVPTTLLEKKLFDSLVGHDQFNNLVPDPKLNYRNKYGLGIRPQQTLFKNRLEALRNIVEFSNSVLIKNKITGNFNFVNLLKEENIPNENSGDYDEIVDNLNDLTYIDVIRFKKAKVICFIENKKIRNVVVTDPGYGYKLPPEIKISKNENNIRFQSTIDQEGRLVEVKIINAGDNLFEPPILEVRNHTVIVSADTTSNNKWSKFEFNYETRNWIKTKTQLYNTPLYWKYTDWKSDKFKNFKNIDYVLSDIGELTTSMVSSIGDYIKINNAGNGKYIIVEKVSNNIDDNLKNFETIFIEDGTLIIKDELWNFDLGKYSYDILPSEQTLYDQTPDLEIFYILKALKENIFINDLKINWNLLFFTAIKYAVAEQKNIDWAFKTSFVNVKNNVGDLNQRSIYKFDNDRYFEDFIKEIKPYKTKIRNYTLSYSNLEDANTFISDFDLPPYFDTDSQKYLTVNETDEIINEYPWKSWKDNNTFYVEKILIADPGLGYYQRPNIIIQSNDSGTGALAEAFVRNGGLVGINILNSGSGYKIPPTVIISDLSGTVIKPAKVSVVLSNNTFRKNLLNIKFDRVSSTQNILTNLIKEQFICDGSTIEFELSWSPTYKKENIFPTLDGKTIFATDYTILYSGARNRFAKFLFLNYVPKNGQIFEITYDKNLNVFNATDRIINFYKPNDNVEGLELSLLMEGISYPNTVIQGLPFDIITSWNPPNNPYENFVWDELTEFYSYTKLRSNLTIGDNVLFLENVENLNQGQIIKILNTSSNILRSNSTIKSINTTNNSIVLNTSSFLIKNIYASNTSTTATITLISKNNFNSLLEIGDYVIVSGVITTGYNGNYVVNNIIGNDTIEFTATSVLSSEQTTILSSAKFEISNILQPLLYDSLLLDNIVTTVTNTSTISIPTFSSLNDISKIEITINGNEIFESESISSYFSTSTYTVFDRLTFDLHNLDINSVNLIDVKLFTFYKVEFWKHKLVENSVDSIILGGTWENSNLLNGLGIEPTDIIIDGNTFVSDTVGHGPEELIKGHVLDSLGINVYTRNENVFGTVFTGVFPGPITTTTSFTITANLYDYSNIMIYSNEKLFEKINSLTFTNDSQYYIEGNLVYIPQQTSSTKIGYTILTTGGGNIIDSTIVFVSGVNYATVESLASINDVKSVYVTVNGEQINEISNLNDYGYILESSNSNNNRASVKIYNLNTSSNTIQVWFLNSLITQFGLIYEEYFDNNISSPTTAFQLSRPYTKIEPVSNQYFVEATFLNNTKKQLKPPKVTYYNIVNNILTYKFETDVIRPSNYYDPSEIKVYINGSEIRPGFDVIIDVGNNTITLINGLFNNGDVIAILMLKDFEFLIQNNIFYPQIFAIKYKIISINDDNTEPLLRTEIFNYIPINRYKLSRPILNDNYLWVYVNGIPLIHRYDFEILEDLKTIQLSEWIETDINSEIMIINLDYKDNDSLIGFRIFKNIFDKFEFKRLSNKNTTILSKELFKTDKEIFVKNDSILMTPNKELNKPGIVLIDGERIEFFKKENNVLSELRRYTFGTSSPEYSQIGSTVIDQSAQQSIPYIEKTNIQKIIATNTNTYYISTQTNTSTGQGILLDVNLPFEDQVLVFLGGKQLRKNNLKIQDVENFYSSNDSELITLEKEFFITKNESNLQILKLNVKESNISGIEISIIQKKGYVWSGTESLLTSDVVQAKFLRSGPSLLPDYYYYGGFKEIVDVSYDPLTDENDDPLEE